MSGRFFFRRNRPADRQSSRARGNAIAFVSTGTAAVRPMARAGRLVLRASVAVWLGFMVPPLAAQQAPPLFLVADSDSVRVIVPDPPPGQRGFVLYRGLAGAELQPITPEPIRPVRDPGLAAALLGDDLDLVSQALRTTDPVEALRRLESDRFAAHVLSLLSSRVALVLGRHYQDRGLQPGQEYEYRLAFVDARDEELDATRTARVRIVDVAPGTTQALTAQAEETEVVLEWRYPAYTGQPDDLVLGFHVYRGAAPDSPLVRLTTTPVLRDDVSPPRYRDRDVRPGQSYRYEVRAVDMVRREGPAAAAAATVPVVPRPPVPPTELATRAGERVVLLVWRMSPEVDAVGYHVERSTGLDLPFERLTTEPLPVLRPEYRDTTVAGGIQYFYRVVAIDRSGAESRPSNAAHAVPVDRTPPAPPANVRVTVEDRQLTIRWDASPSADVIGYYVYRGADERRMVRLVQQPVPGNEYVDTGYDAAGLTPGGDYRISVSAVDRSFNESELANLTVTVPDDEPPAPPTGFAARNVNGLYVELGWSASPALDVMEYVLSRRTGPGEPAELGRFAADRGRRARDTTAIRGEHYTYLLVAVDSAGNLSESAQAELFFRGFDPPPAPRHLSARPTAAGIELRWERVVHDELAGYRVYRSTRPTGVFELLTAGPVTELTFTDSAGDAAHYYVVRAVDLSGNESRSSPLAGGRS